MYNSLEKIMDIDLTNLSYMQGINRDFTMEEVLNSGLWHVITGNGFYKCIPLFNCDSISSSDDTDKILDDNKCLITIGDNADTVISCVSDDTGSIHYHDIMLYAYTPYSKLDLVDEVVVYCIVYDDYLNTLNNVPVNVVVDGDVVSQISTDNNGICRFTIKQECTVQFAYNEIDSNVITITEE